MFNHSLISSRQFNSWRLFAFTLWVMLLAILPRKASAHQSPNTVVLLDVNPRAVSMELQMPLTELELAFGNNISKNPEQLIKNFGPQLKEYLKAHVHAYQTKTNPWLVEVQSLRMDKGTYAENNLDYWELVASVTLTPQAEESTRKFTLDYDVIMHQVINHAALVSVRRDWEAGQIDSNITSAAMVISTNTRDNVIYPLQINLEEGSNFKGFLTMLNLGMAHIKEGTDHLLFLLTLLLPATLTVSQKRWNGFSGTKRSLLNILRIVTAFTLGHSVTLLIGALGIIHFPARFIEVLIALSILISAIHAIKPIFPGRETYIAAGFGLIHGMAFAETLVNLHLDGLRMALSILGFNLGIELMQLFIIAVIIPWLIILSYNQRYTILRIAGGAFAGVAAMAWMAERISQTPNFITEVLNHLPEYGWWIVTALAVVALLSFLNLNKAIRLQKIFL